MSENTFWQGLKVLIMIIALILAILWALKVLNILEAGLKLIELGTGINYFTI